MASEATGTLLDDIDDKFCQCCLCFEQYKDPRQLPCLHRYCRGCLDEEINRNHGILKCPLCQQEVDVPEDGAKGLKKDFFMNEIIDYLELKKFFQDEGSHTCGDCSEDVKATSYCFRCSDFLCDGCNEYHLKKKSLKEHRPYLLTLKDIKTKNITLQKLSSLKQAPMCETHPDDVSRLCCKTCRNMPVCLACTYGDHKTHEIEDVISFARAEKERLRSRLTLMNDARNKIRKTSEKVEKLKNDIATTADRKIADIDERAGKKLPKIVSELESVRESRSAAAKQIKDEGKSDSLISEQQLEDKIMQLRREHELHEQKCREEIETKIKASDAMYSVKESKLLRDQEGIQKEVLRGKALFERERVEKMGETAGVLESIDSTVKRLQNLTETGSNILVSENNWTAIQNVERICLASDSLLQDAAREFPDLDKVLEYSQVRLSIDEVRRIRISEKPEIVVDIGDIGSKMWYINGVAAIEDGSIVITGGTTGKRAHISVIGVNGKILKQRLIESVSPDPLCCCAFFKDDKVVVATKCNANLGLYGVRDNSYHKINISDVIGKGVKIICITANGETNLISVGCDNDPVVYMFNDKLELVRTMNLPVNIISPKYVGMSSGKIFVGAKSSKTACAVSMDGKLMYKFPKPEIRNCGLPFSICADKTGLVFILWTEKDDCTCEQDCVLVKYNPDDGHILMTVTLRAVQGWITTAGIDGEEKLLLPSQKSGKLRVFGLYEE